MKNKIFYTAFYIRLSREDGDNLESESIKNQRGLLQMFLEKTEEKLIYETTVSPVVVKFHIAEQL